MGSLYQKRGWWYYRYSIGGVAKSKALRTQDKTTAARLCRLYDGQIELGRHGLSQKSAPVAASVQQYLEEKAPTLRPGSRERYLEHSRKWLDFLEGAGVSRLEKVTGDLVARYVADRLKVRAAKTVEDEVAWFRSLLRHLWKKRQLSEMPVRVWPVVKVRPVSADRVSFYSRDELARLREYFRFHPFEPIFLFGLLTGARREEIMVAQVSDVRLGEGVVLLRNKKTGTNPRDEVRAVGIHPDLRRILEDRTRGRAAGDPVFPEMAKHSRNWCQREMEKACRASGVVYRRFHGLRHSFCSYLLAAGVDVRAAMAATGHKKLETLLLYAGLVDPVADVGKLGI